MTEPAESASGDTGTALATIEPVGRIETFAAKTESAEPSPRTWRTRMLDYSAHAAMIVGLVGFAWTVGDHVVHRPASEPAGSVNAAAMTPVAPVDPVDELRARNGELAATVKSLQARLDAIQAGVSEQGKVAAQVKVLQAGLDNVKSDAASRSGEQSAAIARLDGKIDKLAHEPGSKMQQLVDRLGRLERNQADPTPTASLPRAGEKVAEAKPADVKAVDTRTIPAKTADSKMLDQKAAETKVADRQPVPRPTDLKGDDALKPQVLANWVVRDVYDGVAVVEGRRGTFEVVPGVSIPGAGIVKSIDRRGNGWTVTTTKGVVAYAAPQRDTRRVDRGGWYGPGYREDF